MHLRRRNTGKKERTKMAWMKRACFASSWKKWEMRKREAGYLAFESTELVTLVGGSE